MKAKTKCNECIDGICINGIHLHPLKEFNLRKELNKIYNDYTKSKFDGMIFIRRVDKKVKEFIRLLKEDVLSKGRRALPDIDKLAGKSLVD